MSEKSYLGRSDHEQRQEDRRNRYEDRAGRLEGEAEVLIETNRAIAGAMNGTPVLVGHHSERKHRREIERMHRRDAKAFGNLDQAQSLRRRAKAIGSAGVSQDDPEALVKLRGQVVKLEHDRESMKRVNAAWRKAKKPDAGDTEGWEAIAATLAVDLSELASVRKSMTVVPWDEAPFPPYALSNLGANLRRYKQRLTTLEAENKRRKAAAEAGDDEPTTLYEHPSGISWEVAERFDLNRLTVTFSQRIPKPWFRLMRQRGFRWMRSEECFSRHLNPGARNAARYASERLLEMKSDSE